ncbi:MAG: BlaI/MecI/CopY family transcriptional regulator [Ahniella sp.]|nr:BlaI/MecI/CopY family transcriptional regulator [Ahniella sp.]
MTHPEAEDLGQLSGLQLAIMRAIWQRGEASTAEVVASLADSRDLAHTTVGTMLSRLERRGLIESRKAGKHLVYRATVAETEVKRSMVSEFLDRLFDGDAKALVAHLVRERDVRDTDLDKVRELLKKKGSDHV